MKLWFHTGKLAWHFYKLYINYPQINYYVCSCGQRTYKKDFTDTPVVIDQDWVNGKREEPRTPSHLKCDFVKDQVREKERIKKEAEKRSKQDGSVDRMNKHLKEYKYLLNEYIRIRDSTSLSRVRHYEDYVIPMLIKEHGQINVDLYWNHIRQEPEVH